jgi:hypothetical protein
MNRDWWITDIRPNGFMDQSSSDYFQERVSHAENWMRMTGPNTQSWLSGNVHKECKEKL